MQSQEGSSDGRQVTNSSHVHYRGNNGLRMRKDMHFRFVRKDAITELVWKVCSGVLQQTEYIFAGQVISVHTPQAVQLWN